MAIYRRERPKSVKERTYALVRVRSLMLKYLSIDLLVHVESDWALLSYY